MSETLIIYIFLPIIGFFIGLLVTMWGAGGGGLYVPILILLFGIEPQIAIATSLITIIPVTLIGSASHWKERNVNVKVGLIFATGGLVGALLGTYLSNLIPGPTLEKIIAFFLIGISILMLFGGKGKIDKVQKKDLSEPIPKINRKTIFIGITFGFVSGLMSGLAGLSGSPPIIGGLYLLNYPLETVVGTSVFITLFNATFAAIGYGWFGQFNLIITLLLGLGASMGAFIGPKVLNKIKGRKLEKIYMPTFVAVMIIMGVMLLLDI